MQKTIILTDAQIESLYRFCAKHYVHYYDLQTELVDHLASAIEDKMTANPTLSFEKALDEVYRGFGVMGFAPVIAERTKQLMRIQQRLRRSLILQYFGWPKLAFTLCMATAIFMAGKWLPLKVMDWVGFIVIALVLALEIGLSIRIGRMRKAERKRLLLTNNITGGFLVGNLCLQFWISRFLWGNEGIISNYKIYGLTVLVSISVIAIISYYEYCQTLYQQARKQYPEVFA